MLDTKDEAYTGCFMKGKCGSEAASEVVVGSCVGASEMRCSAEIWETLYAETFFPRPADLAA